VKAILIILFILYIPTVRAQDEKWCSCSNAMDESFRVSLKGQVYKGTVGLRGTEFFKPVYLSGSIFLEDGEVAENVQLKYNGRIDELLLLPPNSGKEIMLDRFFIREFWLKNEADSSILDFKKIKVPKESTNDTMEVFGQLLYHDNLSLFAYRHYDYIKEIVENINDIPVSWEVYGPSFVYYFQLPNNKMIAFKSFRKKDLYKLFPGDVELMKKLFREKHIRKFRKEEDLIRITKVLNLMYT
jgi:hypothetical protein